MSASTNLSTTPSWASSQDWRSLSVALALHATVVGGGLFLTAVAERPVVEHTIMASLLSAPSLPIERPTPTHTEPLKTPAAPKVPKAIEPVQLPAPLAPLVQEQPSPVLTTQAAVTETVPVTLPNKLSSAPTIAETRHDRQEEVKPSDKTASSPPASASPSSSAVSDSELQPYLAALMRRLARHKVYPAALKKEKVEGRVMLKFTISANGQLIASSVQKSSGHTELDQAALDMLARASPLPPVPTSMQRSELSLSIPVEYSLIKDP